MATLFITSALTLNTTGLTRTTSAAATTPTSTGPVVRRGNGFNPRRSVVFGSLGLASTRGRRVHRVVGNRHSRVGHPPLRRHHTVRSVVTDSAFSGTGTRTRVTGVRRRHGTGVLTRVRARGGVCGVLAPRRGGRFGTGFRGHLARHPTTGNGVPTATRWSFDRGAWSHQSYPLPYDGTISEVNNFLFSSRAIMGGT